MSDELLNSGNPKLTALRVLDEPQFIRIISIAIARHRGVLTNAAKSLKVHRNTLTRWIEQYPELGAEVVRIRVMYSTPTAEE